MGTVDRKTLMQTGLVTRAVQGRAAPRSWLCRVVGDGDGGRQLSLGARPVVVGAHGSCDLILDDPQVSRRHAELQVTDDGVRVRDLGSTNGTFWRSSRISEAVVGPGSTVRFGQTSVQVSTAEVPCLPPSERRQFGGLVGRSAAMRELFAVLEMAAPTDATVLIEGESGTGKELAARAVHDHSPRAHRPFVVVDCSAVSEQLIDSQLFGHVKGSFTGAAGDRQGAFVAANGGTVFLDELGELSLPVQAKLLRVLEARTVQPVGSDHRVAVDTRVVAATHRDLAHMVETKQFRFDLFYRLAVVHVSIPPLAERPEDIPELVGHFYRGRDIDPGPIVGANLDRLMRHGWPGNVRELRNVLERAWAMSGPDGARFADLRLWVRPGAAATQPVEIIDLDVPFKEAKERWVEHFERRYLAGVFAAHNGNITHTAEHAGINRRHLRTLLRKYGILSEE
ncbi:MAG: sigma 54-interacting transcriptional regulator [Myxococcota bacterium]